MPSKELKKLYKNWTVHNLIGHPLSEVAYLLLRLFSQKKAEKVCGMIHDATLPEDTTNGRG